MKCEYCSREAIEIINGKAYCEEHFSKYFLGKVRGIIDKFNIKGKIAVALSGGKDSAACLHALHSMGMEVKPFYINLRIPSYSEACEKKAAQLCDMLGYEMKVIDVAEYGISLEKERKPCSTCGTVKRYLMNKFAFDEKCTCVATGHNLSDAVTFAFNNLANVNILNFRGNKPYLEGKEEYRMVAKVKPLYWLKDKECMLYTIINNLPFAEEECPYSINAPTLKIKDWLHALEGEWPNIMVNLAKSFWRLEEMMEKKSNINICKKCGFASYGSICKFCKIRAKMEKQEK